MPQLTYETWNCQVPFLCRWMRWSNNTCSGWVDWNKMYILYALQEHSACAWEIVRKEIRENLVQFKKFIDSRVKLWGEPQNHHWRLTYSSGWLTDWWLIYILTDWPAARLTEWLIYLFIYLFILVDWYLCVHYAFIYSCFIYNTIKYKIHTTNLILFSFTYIINSCIHFFIDRLSKGELWHWNKTKAHSTTIL